MRTSSLVQRRGLVGRWGHLRRWAVLVPLFMLGGCELDWVEINSEEELLAASVTVVLTVDPADSSVTSTDIVALLTREGLDTRVPGASVRITGESEQSLQLAEASDRSATCRSDTASVVQTVGTCYTASTSSAHFAPLEELSLKIVTQDGRVLRGVSTIPRAFAPTRLSVHDGRCRVDPDTSYLFDWSTVDGDWAFIAEAKFSGFARALWDDPDPLYLRTYWMASPLPQDMVFPRIMTEGEVARQARKAARKLETGLPWGVTADLAVAAVDRNWANWIREGQLHTEGEVRVPSVFGDGTGMFGTGIRWTVTMESRGGQEEAGLVDCGLRVVLGS